MTTESNKVQCCICSRLWPREKCFVVVLTPDERSTVLTKFGTQPQDEYVYCPPCVKLLRNREQGASFIKGVYQASLGASRDAEKIATRLYNHLLKVTEKKP